MKMTSMDENNCAPTEVSIEALSDKVKQLFTFRDHYFENHSIDDASRKNKDVTDKMKETVNILERLKDPASKANKAMYCYLRGRALNVTPQFNAEAEEMLSKALKLDPKFVDAWNELGECYWKKDDITAAKNCFTTALSHKKNKISLRNLSMVLRQEPSKTPQERIKNIEEGLNKAREAVQLDPNDGQSWAILGNSYLSSYFTISQNPKILKQCMSAYFQAEKDITASSSPELHYNKAIAYKYEEEYNLALESFSKAQSLEPTWDDPRLKERQLLKYLENVQDLVKHKGKLKGKKYSQLVQSIDEKQLGPYYGGSYTSSKGESIVLECIPFSNLQEGLNENKVIFGKVVCSIQDEDAVPFTFCMVDKVETCIAVTVYNFAKGKGVIIGDSVAIPEPYLTKVSVETKDAKYFYNSVRVNSPLVLVVNSKKMGINQQASAQLSTYKKKD
ncbi:tetratricopeptide repeat protein 5-like [Schistocerca cancellata]|uniref:tetratricopeptide repeat protein 5-like n=1 Tax=Schistocerca cancellata TaxID=274614 RepID=UPI002118B03C|nr:tetratricopeptide repeat protein 5-like [Schistocerca cancellata]